MRSQGLVTLGMLVYLIVVGWWADSAAQLASTSRISLVGGHLAVYSTFLEQYARANPSASGQPSDAALNAPSWFQRAPSETGYVSGGKSYAYVIPLSRADGMAIARGVGGSSVGINDSGVLTPPGGAASGITVPPAIPSGVVVLVQQ